MMNADGFTQAITDTNPENKMKNARIFTIVMLVMSLAILACGSSTVTETAPQVETNTSVEPVIETATVLSTKISVASPSPTTAPLQLEVVQSQTWTDYQGNARVNVLFRNPYDFPVAASGGNATLKNSAGELIRSGDLYFLDGISGGNGFILPGETIAANACFTCEAALLTEEWASVNFGTTLVDATDRWVYFTEVEASGVKVSFNGDSPIFDVSGTVKNNSGSALQRISVRIFVFDQEGKLVGAAEASAWDVGAGASVSFNGYGIGQTPVGTITFEVTALGVNY